ncbi:hypothetical protein KLP28_05310 [Nocardioidaceae bacterium]|nr:hypothetical protein KLP28_05310 [Nocardioidaceae bacterium]
MRRRANAAEPTRDAYDVLDVPRSATPEEVRAAWSSRVTALDPSKDSATLVELNAAAETLLDPTRRATLDRELEAREAAETAAAAAAQDPATEPSGKQAARRPRRRLLGTGAGLVLLVALSVAATVALVLAVLLGQQAEDAQALEEAWEVVPATATQAAEAVLGYDYEQLDADAQAARQWLTPAYRREYDAQFQQLEESAVEQEVRVAAQAYAAGIVAITPLEDGAPQEASVLLFVDQTRTVAGEEELPVANRVRFDMVQRDGRWLIDDIVTLDNL